MHNYDLQVLYQANLGPEVYARFTNGLCYEYIDGVTLTETSVREDGKWQGVAREMAKFHKIEVQLVQCY